MEEPSHSSALVLVVDDDPALRWIARTVLQAAGFTVREAAHGVEALAGLLVDPRPDMVLLDLRMPVMDGACFLASMRADPRFAALPVVLYSSESDLAARACELGTAGFLAKPGDLESLVEVARQHCGKRQVRIPMRRDSRRAPRPSRSPARPSTLPP